MGGGYEEVVTPRGREIVACRLGHRVYGEYGVYGVGEREVVRERERERARERERDSTKHKHPAMLGECDQEEGRSTRWGGGYDEIVTPRRRQAVAFGFPGHRVDRLRVLRCKPSLREGSGFRVQGAGFRVQGAGLRAQSSGCRVLGSGCRVQGSGCRVQASGFQVPSGSQATELIVFVCSAVNPPCQGGGGLRVEG